MATAQNQTKKKKGKAEHDEIIQEVKRVIKLFSSKMSLRQIYYQLVTKQLIPNSLNEYKALSTLLVKARKDGRIKYEDIEDRTRSFDSIMSQSFKTINAFTEDLVNFVKFHEYRIPLSTYQPILHIIAVEKQALGPFFLNQIPEERNVILMVNRGYNSLTQIYELANTIRAFKQIKQIHISYFGDHDPTGYDIEKNMVTQLNEQGINLTSCERIGINREQILKYKLPEAAAKPTDARTKNWMQGGCVELDALPPSELIRLIKERIEMFWDMELQWETEDLNKVLNKRFHKRLEKELKGWLLP